MQRKWKRRWQRLAKIIVSPLTAGMLMLSAYSPVFANPTGGNVTSGTVTITANGSTMTVNQTTNKAVINWQSFSIGKGETVNFLQPTAASVALNRVVGNNASSIYGNLNANGRVYLVNPNGILFAPGSQVNVGGLVASTLNISDNDLLNGNYVFEKNGSAGTVVNQGNITAADHVALLGPQVKNEGVIAARVTGLAAGNKVRLDFNGDKLLNVTVDTGAVNGSAANTGTIASNGGLVVMSAGTKDKLLNTVVNNSGMIRAQSVNNVNGVIRLEGGSVTNSGTLDASGKTSGQVGGTVEVLGDNITLSSGSSIDVSGNAGGGTALIGGAYQGGNSEYAATNTTIQKGAAIHADALTSGDGGQVVVWANDTTTFAGNITARGGAVSGDGGSMETSGHTLTVSGTVDAGATKGKNGNWLLDPEDLTVDATAATTISSALNSNTNVTLQTTSTTASGTGTVTGGGNGDITIAAPLTWNTGTGTLTLSAYNNINLNSSITATNGGLTLTANTSGTGNGTTTGIITPATGSSISVGTFTLTSGTWRENNSSLSSFYAKDFRRTGGTFLRVRGGTGDSSNPYKLGDVYGLQGIASSADLLGSSFELVNNIDASGTKNWNALAGFVPIGNATTSYSGSFDGKGHTISGLYINRSGTDYVGLFGMTKDTGTVISNLGIIGGSVTGKERTGGLVGQNRGKIYTCYYEGTVQGSNYVGGLVGVQDHYASIFSSYTKGMVVGSNDSVGGLVGQSGLSSNPANNYSLISACYSASNVQGDNEMGGLVGWNYDKCQITQSYATGVVQGNRNGLNVDIGGLVGNNAGEITYSYSTGNVSGLFAGGLVGYLVQGASLQFCYSTGDVNVTNGGIAGGLVGTSVKGSIDSCYSAGAASGGTGTVKGGLVGEVQYTSNITNCYYDATKNSGVSPIGAVLAGSANGTPVALTTDQMRSASSFANWKIVDTANNPSYTSADWVIVNGSTRPFLQKEYSTNITNVHQLQLMAMDLGASYTLANNIDMSEVKQSSGLWATSTKVPGFLPIGTRDAPFTGSFTGNGHSISNIYINRIDIDNVGLFGASTGQISGVALLGGSVQGGNQVGGLVGFNKTSAGKVTGSYSTCSVIGTSNVGGLVGSNWGLISDCYSTGQVSGQSYVGGLVGDNSYDIRYSYSTGVVSGTGYKGGLVGYNTGLVGYSYWDTETSGISNSAAGTPRTTADMMIGGNFQNFDFVNTWGIVEGSSYPYLRSQYAAAPQVVSGTVSDHGKGYAVNLISQGNLLNTVYTGANGFYFFLLDQGTITADNALLAYINDGSIKGSALRNVASATDSITGFTITTGTVAVNGAASTLDITGLMTKAIGGLTDTDFLYSVSGGVINVEKDLSVTAAGGSITQGGALTVNGTTTLSAGNGINLSKANKLTGTVSLSSPAGDVTINNTVATVLGVSNVSGNLVVTANGAITQNGALTVTGTTKLAAGSGNDITLDQAANALTGAISITSGKAVTLNNTLATVLGVSNVSNNLMVSSGGAIMQSGALTVSGTTNLTAGSGNNITLDKTNALTGAISIVSGNDVTLKNNKATKIGASTVSGSLGVTSNGAITQSGALTVTGTTILAAGTGNNITLDQAANALTGVIRIASGKDVTLNNTLATVLGVSSVSGKLAVTSDGAITQNGALTVTGTTTLAAGSGNNITLDQAANALTGAISIASGNDATIKNALATGLDNASVSGKLTLIANDAVNPLTLTVNGEVNAAGDILLEAPGNFTIGGAASIHSSNGNVSLVSTQGNFLNNAGSNAVLAGSGKRWLIYAKSLTGNTPGNLAYDFSQYGTAYGGTILAAGNAFIYSDALNVTASLVGQVTKTYDGTVAADVQASNISMSGLSGAVYDGIGIGVGSSYDGSNAGTDLKVTTGIVSLMGIKDSNNKPVYGYNYTPSALSGNIGVINKANLTVTTSNVAKTYDSTTSAAGSLVIKSGTLYTNTSNGSTQDSVSGGTFAYTDANAGSGNKTVTVSSVTVNDGNSGQNYHITYEDNTTSTINKANLTVTTGNVTKPYDGTTSATGSLVIKRGTLYTNTSNGSTQDSVSGGTFAYTDANAGSGNKTVTVSGVTVNDGNSGQNYHITYEDNTTSTINKANLTVTTSNVTKPYDGTTSATGSLVIKSGTLYTNTSNGGSQDSISGGTFAYTDANAGSGNKTVTVSGVTVNDGNSGQNYHITYEDNATSTINKANLTVTTGNATKTYDGTTSATGSLIIKSGTLYTNTSNGGIQDSLSGGTFAYTDANTGSGNKTVTVSGVTVNDGNSGQNYHITYEDNTTSTINKANLTVTTGNVTKTYDGTTSATGSLIIKSGTLYTNTSNASIQDSVSGGTFAYTDANAGSGNKTVTVSSATVNDGNGGQNYHITYEDNTTSTINKANLTVTTGNVTKTYDGTTSAAGSLVIKNGTLYTNTSNGSAQDSLSGGTFAYTDANAGSGNKTVTVSGVTVNDGNSGQNYHITYEDNATSTINKANLTVTTGNATKTYDGTTSATGSLIIKSGTLYTNTSNDGIQDSVSGGTFAYTDANAGTGNKTLKVSGVTVNDGNSGQNYHITYEDNTTSTINKANLTVIADNMTKYTGQTNPAFTASYSGLANSDSPASLTGTLTFGTAATTASSPGTYAITLIGTLASSNYIIAYADGKLTVTGGATNLAYDGAVIHAEQIPFHLPSSGSRSGVLSAYWSPLSGYMAGTAGTYVPLTIRGIGINTNDYVSWNG